MTLNGYRVAITGAGRDFGQSLAISLADLGAEVFISARDIAATSRICEHIRQRGGRAAHAFACDLNVPESVRAFAANVAESTDHIDVLVNNAARYLHGLDLLDASDEDIADTITSTSIGTVLVTKHFLPLLQASDRPDIVTMVSACGATGYNGSHAHPAYYAAKHAQAGFTRILSQRLRRDGVRVMSLYPPDFTNPDRLSSEWTSTSRTAQDQLTAQSLIDSVLFAINQPRDNFLRELHFEER